MKTTTRAGILAATAAAALALTGCEAGFSVGDGGETTSAAADDVVTVTPEKLAERATEMISQQTGSTPAQAVCAGPLTMTEGATQKCAVLSGATGDWYEAVVSVSNVQGTNGDVGIKVGDSPVPKPSYVDGGAATENATSAQDLAQNILDENNKRGYPTKSVKCQGPLELREGATQKCAYENDKGEWRILNLVMNSATADDWKVTTEPEVIPEPSW